MMHAPPAIAGAVEGLVDEAVLRRPIRFVRAEEGSVYGKKGKAFLLQRIAGFNQAAGFAPWVVLIDLDQDYSCAPPARKAWLPEPAKMMCFRIVVRQVESWLLADAERMASFLRILVSSMSIRTGNDA